MSWGRSSLNTPSSRIRRAISCEYWPPKSRTRTSSAAAATSGAVASVATISGSAPGTLLSGTWTLSVTVGSCVAASAAAERLLIRGENSRFDVGLAVRAHPHVLLLLELLALGLQRRRDHHLGAVELG